MQKEIINLKCCHASQREIAWSCPAISVVAMGCAGCAMQGPGGKGALWGAYSGISFFAFRYRMLSNQLKSTVFYTYSLNSCVSVKWPRCWFSNQPACHTHRGTAEVVLTDVWVTSRPIIYVFTVYAVDFLNYCKKLNSLKHLVRTNVAESHN